MLFLLATVCLLRIVYIAKVLSKHNMATRHFMSCPSPEDRCPSKLFSLYMFGVWLANYGTSLVSFILSNFWIGHNSLQSHDPVHVTCQEVIKNINFM